MVCLAVSVDEGLGLGKIKQYFAFKGQLTSVVELLKTALNTRVRECGLAL